MFEQDPRLRGARAVGDLIESLVVKDPAVLQYLDERAAAVACRRLNRFFEMIRIRINGPCDKSSLSGQSRLNGMDWLFDRAERAGFGTFAKLGRGRVLALGQPINPIIKEEDLNVEVAAQAMDEVVGPDGQPVAIACDNPDGQIGVGT